MSFFIDVGAVGIRKFFEYQTDLHLATQHRKYTKEPERKRRIELALEASSSLTDYANNARNATSGEPQKVLIIFDTKLSRKAARYFKTASEAEKENILRELDKRGAKYFFGDDTVSKPETTSQQPNGQQKETDENENLCVFEAYEKALEFLEKNLLFDPSSFDDKTKDKIFKTEDLSKAKQ